MAAIGDVRAAPIAGTIAATRVTPTPTMNAYITVCAVICGVKAGNDAPMRLKKPRRPYARPIPVPMPVIDDTSPITIDSATTEPSTCSGVAPIARRSPSSRVRWLIESYRSP